MRICKHLIVIHFVILVLSGCEGYDYMVLKDDTKPSLSSFAFLKDNNPQLDHNIFLRIENDSTILGYAYGVNRVDKLIATYKGNFTSVKVNEVSQTSGISSNDYSSRVDFVLTDSEQNEKIYSVLLFAQNGIPRIDIITEDLTPVLSKTKYVNASVKISNCPDFGVFESSCSIKGHGNATWNFPKKPYKIRLQGKSSIFDFPADKHWVLLSEYSDKSLLRTAFQCEVSKALGFDYTFHYKHVDLYLNGDYQGIYLLAEQVRTGKNRVKVEDDGFLFEKDYYYSEEPLFFTTESFGYNYTFKYPDADNKEITYGDDNYKFIKELMNAFEHSILKIEEGSKEYLNYIDVNSFAKWYIGQEILGNYDPNRYFVLTSKGQKLKMGPMWDAEWSLGLATLDKEWKKPPFLPSAEAEIWSKREYIQYLLKDEYFRQVVKDEWSRFKHNVNNILDNIQRNASLIEYATVQNYSKWPILNDYISVGLVAFGDWHKEVSYILSFYEKRVEWFDQYLNNGFKR